MRVDTVAPRTQVGSSAKIVLREKARRFAGVERDAARGISIELVSQ